MKIHYQQKGTIERKATKSSIKNRSSEKKLLNLSKLGIFTVKNPNIQDSQIMKNSVKSHCSSKTSQKY